MQTLHWVVTLINVLHQCGDYTHSFLSAPGTCWALPPPQAGDGISCSVGKIIVGISKKRLVR